MQRVTKSRRYMPAQPDTSIESRAVARSTVYGLKMMDRIMLQLHTEQHYRSPSTLPTTNA